MLLPIMISIAISFGVFRIFQPSDPYLVARHA